MTDSFRSALLVSLTIWALFVPTDVHGQTQFEAEAALLWIESTYMDVFMSYQSRVDRKLELSDKLDDTYNALTIMDQIALNSTYNDGLEAINGADGQLSLAATSLDTADQHIDNAWIEYYASFWTDTIQEVTYAYDAMYTWNPTVPWRLGKADEYLGDAETCADVLWFYANGH